MRDGRSASEADVAHTLMKIIADAPRCVAVTLFASNVARVASIAEAARKSGRTLVVAGRALHRIIEVAGVDRVDRHELEVAQVDKFDFVIINELFESALFDLKAVVHAQRLKYAAQRRARADTFKSLNIT